jgi:hypothetical protein
MNSKEVKKPVIILAVETREIISPIKNFFLENSPFYTVLKEPPYLRYMGWNMLTLDIPRIKAGQFWEVNNGERKKIRLYRDGTLIARADANSDFLGWGQNEVDFEKNPRINPLALIEFIYEFVHLYFITKIHFPKPLTGYKFTINFKNLVLDSGERIYLPNSEINRIGAFTEEHEFSDSELKESVGVDQEEFNEVADVQNVAYQVAEKIFNKAGIPSNKIPYTTQLDDGKWIIDVDRIKKIDT